MVGNQFDEEVLQSAAARQTTTPTLLLVEPEIRVRLPVANYLRECGYRVLEASSASEAQAIWEMEPQIDVVLTDVDLPGTMNGFALAHWLRQARPGVRVVLTSGSAAMARMAEDACESGPHLRKPYAQEDLLRHIQQLLATRPG